MAAAANGWSARGLSLGRRILVSIAAFFWRNLANLITLSRLVAVLPIWLLIDAGALVAALVVFVVAAASDAVDGAVAKATGTASTFGAILDPLVDKLMLGFLFIIAGTLGWTSVWLVALIVGRDLALGIGALNLQVLSKTRRLEPLVIGKLCTMSQFVFYGVLLAEAGDIIAYGLLHQLTAALVVLTATASIAAYLYFARFGLDALSIEN
jgi:cardiolipin synthase (CMP-forming)